MVPVTLSPAAPAGPSPGGCLAVIVRHGQTAFNLQNLFRGRFDVPLDPAGLRQAGQTASFLASAEGLAPISAVYSGPLRRARETAAPGAELLGLEVDVVPELDDVDVGRWQARSAAEIAASDPVLYRSWHEDPAGFTFPEGESLAAVMSRTAEFVDRLRAAHRGRRVVLVTHRVPAKLIVLRALGLGPEAFWRVRIDPCSVSAAMLGGESNVLTLLNCTAHLHPANQETGPAASKPDF